MSTRRTLVLAVAAAALLSTPALAQGRSGVSGAELNAAAAAARPSSNRQVVREFLGNGQVQRVAGSMGVQTADLASRVATLDDASLAPIARQIESDLAGGANSIVLSTTAVIIGLLVIIILLVD